MKKTNYLLMTLSVVMMAFFSSCEQKCKKCEKNVLPEGTFTYADEGRTPEMLDYNKIVTMLRNYDQTRIRPLEEALGYEDTRVDNYNFEQFKKYLGRIENLSKKAGVKITGLSFIAAADPNYGKTGKSYQDLIYIPTTTIKGKQIPFDPVQSLKQGRLVTFKEMLADNGYNWIYNTKKDFETGKRKDYNYSIERAQKQNKAGILTIQDPVDLSGAGNYGQLTPPF